MWLLYAPTWILTGVSNFIIRKILNVPGSETDTVFSRIDLEEYINENISESEDIDKKILTNALNLGQFKVRDCMIPAMKSSMFTAPIRLMIGSCI